MVSPRVYQAMAANGLFFPQFARLHPRFRTPATAIVFQGLWAILLLQASSYGTLLDYVVFCDWIFFGLAVATLFVIPRAPTPKRRPSTGRRISRPGPPSDPHDLHAGGALRRARFLRLQSTQARRGTGPWRSACRCSSSGAAVHDRTVKRGFTR